MEKKKPCEKWVKKQYGKIFLVKNKGFSDIAKMQFWGERKITV